MCPAFSAEAGSAVLAVDGELLVGMRGAEVGAAGSWKRLPTAHLIAQLLGPRHLEGEDRMGEEERGEEEGMEDEREKG